MYFALLLALKKKAAFYRRCRSGTRCEVFGSGSREGHLTNRNHEKINGLGDSRFLRRGSFADVDRGSRQWSDGWLLRPR